MDKIQEIVPQEGAEMWDKDKHMEGFEKEATLFQMHGHPEVRNRLYKWRDFMAVSRIINPDLCARAFERRPCVRTLRYIGHDNFDESIRSKEPTGPHVYGNIYSSVDFNGGTYTIKETGGIMGSAFFEVVS
jgi:hypothetical protein